MTTRWPYQTVGEPSKPPLIFLHGFLGRGVDWLPVAHRLAGDYYCLLFDLPGHGENIALEPDSPLSFAHLSGQLHRQLAAIAPDRIRLVGYSMGGRLALYYALHFPQTVAALALEGASPGLADVTARQERAALDDERAARLLTEGMDAFLTQWYQLPLFASLQEQPDVLARTIGQRRANDPRWAAKVIRELSPGRQPSLWAQLPQLLPPALLLAGGLDERYSAVASRMAKKIPQAVVKIAPHAGHNVHLEQPELFAGLLAEFFAAQIGSI
jgi:2-succinyl-6-hydroxy-2,4-cyclohexadiene-1-carboxylate synthase